MLRVPTMTQAPMNKSHQALMLPRLVNRPSCRSGMARSASLARAVVAARSSTASEQRIAFRLDSRGRRDKQWVNMTGEVSSERFRYPRRNLTRKWRSRQRRSDPRGAESKEATYNRVDGNPPCSGWVAANLRFKIG